MNLPQRSPEFDGGADLPKEWGLAAPPERPSTGRQASETFCGRERPIEGTTSVVGRNGFELTLIDQVHEAIHIRGFREVRNEFEELTERVMADPFGDTSIDAFKDTDAGQWARVVHRVEGPLADLVPGKELAIKGTGLNVEKANRYLGRRARLTDQFRATLRVARAQQENAPEGINGSIFVNGVYGVVASRKPDGQIQEWLLMEYIPSATPVENIQLAIVGGYAAPGFEVKDHPELAKVANAQPYDDTVLFSNLAGGLGRILGISPSAIGDLNGNNVLEQDTPDGPLYTIIDVQSL